MASILLVEDDLQLRSMLRIVLDRAGHVVQEAGNGKEAIALYSKSPADLIVTDLVMPDKEGLETIREFRRSYPDVKIIAMSGGGRTGAENYLDLAKKLGADYTLTKPFSNKEILDGIHIVVLKISSGL
jgi:DNA-binding response OmpR family regulator